MAVIHLNALSRRKPPAPVEPDYSGMSHGEKLIAQIEWEKAKPPLFSISLDNVTVLEHDPAYPQWRRPMVWAGESERQVRAVAAELGFERIPLALEEFMVFNAYAQWLYKKKDELRHFPQDPETQADMIEGAVYATALVHKPWIAGVDAYLRGDKAALREAHAGDRIYRRLIKNAGDQLWEHMVEVLARAGGEQPADSAQLTPEQLKERARAEALAWRDTRRLEMQFSLYSASVRRCHCGHDAFQVVLHLEPPLGKCGKCGDVSELVED